MNTSINKLVLFTEEKLLNHKTEIHNTIVSATCYFINVIS